MPHRWVTTTVLLVSLIQKTSNTYRWVELLTSDRQIDLLPKGGGVNSESEEQEGGRRRGRGGRGGGDPLALPLLDLPCTRRRADAVGAREIRWQGTP
jgi:hypothetical protein